MNIYIKDAKTLQVYSKNDFITFSNLDTFIKKAYSDFEYYNLEQNGPLMTVVENPLFYFDKSIKSRVCILIPSASKNNFKVNNFFIPKSVSLEIKGDRFVSRGDYGQVLSYSKTHGIKTTGTTLNIHWDLDGEKENYTEFRIPILQTK